MVFSSPTFLFAFLPLTLLLSTLAPARARNVVLLAASVAFYIWGAGGTVDVIIFVSAAAWIGGLLVALPRLPRSPAGSPSSRRSRPCSARCCGSSTCPA